jgi:hypothetical protein
MYDLGFIPILHTDSLDEISMALGLKNLNYTKKVSPDYYFEKTTFLKADRPPHAQPQGTASTFFSFEVRNDHLEASFRLDPNHAPHHFIA